MEPLNPYEISALKQSMNEGGDMAPLGSLWLDTLEGCQVMILLYANFVNQIMVVYQDMDQGHAHIMEVNAFLGGRFLMIGHVWDRSKI